MKTTNVTLKKGVFYIIETPSENYIRDYFQEYYKFLFDEKLLFQNMEFDYLREKYKDKTIIDIINLFNLNLETIPENINIKLKIKDLSNLFLRCLDYLIKSKEYLVITSLEAMSEKSRDKYILFLKKMSLINKNSYIICLDYPSNINHIDKIKVCEI